MFENYISFLYYLDSEHDVSKISQVVTQNTNFVHIHTEEQQKRSEAEDLRWLQGAAHHKVRKTQGCPSLRGLVPWNH